MTLSKIEWEQIEKNLNNSERFILEKLSSERKSNYRRFEKINTDNAKLLKELVLLNANIKASILLQEKIEKEVWLVSWFYNHTKTFYFMVAIFCFTFIDKLIDVYKLIEKKYIG